MLVTRRDTHVVVDAPAKVNLHLEILGKRADGYHELETLMLTVSLYDRLTFEPTAAGTELQCDSESAGPAAENLVTKAVQLVRSETGRSDGVRVELEKRIPVAAGLAGGSSDAAATLAALNLLWGLGWDRDRLIGLAGRLGSDVAFFFATPAAVATGRGEVVRPIVPGAELDLVLVNPRVGLSTKAVYGKVSPAPAPAPIAPIVAALEAGDRAEIGRRLHNRLESPALGLCPAVAELKRQAHAWPCLGHLMSGSGSTYFALCESAKQAQDLGRRLSAQNLGDVFVVRSSS